ncbi:EthD family reductase [Actinocrispum sp. NPDC049592]|uniref:EthD family reductase n=1 Tax=Actinocrispum sp. NPDC049592 TaxID=3154835 RepID=UPI003449477E
MHKLVVLYPEPVDREHFREYYVNTHLPLVARIPGVLAYRYSFEVQAPRGESPYFAVFEADFADLESYRAGMSTPEAAAVVADVPNYATGGSLTLTYSTKD